MMGVGNLKMNEKEEKCDDCKFERDSPFEDPCKRCLKACNEIGSGFLPYYEPPTLLGKWCWKNE